MTRLQRIVAITIAAATIGLVGCGSDDDTTASTPPETLAAPSTTTTSVVTTTIAAAPTTTAAPATTVRPATTTSAPATTTTTTLPATTTTVGPGAALSLRSDGIADAGFGTEPDEVVAYIAGLLGDPAEDTGWVDAISRTCPGTEVRFVRWGDLTLTFGDDSGVSSGRRHFFAWQFGPAEDVVPAPAGLATPEGISIGSSVVDIGRAYPTASLFEGDELATSSAHISDDLFAFITDTRDSGVVTAMLGGQGCGE